MAKIPKYIYKKGFSTEDRTGKFRMRREERKVAEEEKKWEHLVDEEIEEYLRELDKERLDSSDRTRK